MNKYVHFLEVSPNSNKFLNCKCINTLNKALEEQDQSINEEVDQINSRSDLHLTNTETKLHGVETKSRSC